MVENVEDLTVTYEEDGEVVVEELDKRILSKGAWATVLFKYREFDARKEAMSPTKFTIRRYRKMRGAYRQQGKFNISSLAQATKIVEALNEWLAEESTE